MRCARLEFVGTCKQSAWKGALSCALIFEIINIISLQTLQAISSVLSVVVN
jgi:hypothetical protein